MSDVVVIGASGHSKVIADIIEKCGDKVFVFLDDDTSKPGVKGRISECVNYPDKKFIIAIGNNIVRRKIADEYNLDYYTAIHPSAIIGKDVTIGEGTVIMAGTVINPSTEIGKHCIINSASVVEHDNRLGNFVHISPNATLCGTVTVGENTHIGAGATVKNNINIASDCMIGIGAAVVKDIVESGTYCGVPAKRVK